MDEECRATNAAEALTSLLSGALHDPLKLNLLAALTAHSLCAGKDRRSVDETAKFLQQLVNNIRGYM